MISPLKGCCWQSRVESPSHGRFCLKRPRHPGSGMMVQEVDEAEGAGASQRWGDLGLVQGTFSVCLTDALPGYG